MTIAELETFLAKHYAAFQGVHADLGTIDSPEGFAARFAARTAPVLANILERSA